MSAREKEQADFDLERFIDMFDEALTSKDERVVNALRSLMMMVVLTKPEGRDPNGDVGPLRQMHDDMHNLNRRMHRLEEELQSISRNVRGNIYTNGTDYDTYYKNQIKNEYFKMLHSQVPPSVFNDPLGTFTTKK